MLLNENFKSIAFFLVKASKSTSETETHGVPEFLT